MVGGDIRVERAAIDVAGTGIVKADHGAHLAATVCKGRVHGWSERREGEPHCDQRHYALANHDRPPVPGSNRFLTSPPIK